jgi:hypothetical protein
MTAITLELKERPSGVVLNMPVAMIEELVEANDKNKLWDLFKGLVEKKPSKVHDKRWLELIVNWTPKEGIPLTEGARWLKLAVRVGALDDQREGKFTLSKDHVDQIWKRVTSPEFKINNISLAFAAFILDFQKATGKHFTEEDDFEDKEGNGQV